MSAKILSVNFAHKDDIHHVAFTDRQPVLRNRNSIARSQNGLLIQIKKRRIELERIATIITESKFRQ